MGRPKTKIVWSWFYGNPRSPKGRKRLEAHLGLRPGERIEIEKEERAGSIAAGERLHLHIRILAPDGTSRAAPAIIETPKPPDRRLRERAITAADDVLASEIDDDDAAWARQLRQLVENADDRAAALAIADPISLRHLRSIRDAEFQAGYLFARYEKSGLGSRLSPEHRWELEQAVRLCGTNYRLDERGKLIPPAEISYRTVAGDGVVTALLRDGSVPKRGRRLTRAQLVDALLAQRELRSPEAWRAARNAEWPRFLRNDRQMAEALEGMGGLTREQITSESAPLNGVLPAFDSHMAKQRVDEKLENRVRKWAAARYFRLSA